MKKFAHIEAVLKITERCNINCTYCYMFNKESNLYEKKPRQMTLDTARAVAEFLRNGVLETGAEFVRVIFHGGEPLMMRPAVFDQMCHIFLAEIQGYATVQFAVQTNATLIDDRWIAVFEKHHIGVGVSLDGPREVNDISRVDHRGRGTYDRSIRGTQLLFEAHEQGKISAPGVLCVIDPAQDGGAMFTHLAKDLRFKLIDFLLPIDTRDTMPPESAARVGRFLVTAFDAWNKLGDKSVSVRFFDLFYTFMTGYDRVSRKHLRQSAGTLILTVASDGTFGPDDTLRIVSDDYFAFDCRNGTITEYLREAEIRELVLANERPPTECEECAWVGYCVGGSTNGRVVNRYSKEQGFSRKSILCDGFEGLVDIYATLAGALVDAGYSTDSMYRRLNGAAERILDPVAALEA